MSQLVFIERARATMDANEKGRWITTEEGNHVHLDKNGKPDKGNPHVIKAMKNGGKSAVGKKSDGVKEKKSQPTKSKKADPSHRDMSLSAKEYEKKYKEAKPRRDMNLTQKEYWKEYKEKKPYRDMSLSQAEYFNKYGEFKPKTDMSLSPKEYKKEYGIEKPHRDMSLNPEQYWDKYKETKPYGVFGDRVCFYHPDEIGGAKELVLKKGMTFRNATGGEKSAMRGIISGLTMKGNDRKWKEVAKKVLPAAKEFYKDADLPYVKQDLEWIENKLSKMG